MNCKVEVLADGDLFWAFVASVAPGAIDLAEHDRLIDALGLAFADADPIRCAASAATANAVKAGFIAGWLACKEPERLIFRCVSTPEQ